MDINRELALKIWKDIFGEKKWAQDCFGTWMFRDDYGDRDKIRNDRPNGSGKFFTYGWEIDHIRPKSDFKDNENSDFLNNFEPMHYQNNQAKADKLNFVINNVSYSVVECSICKSNGKKGYGIKRNDNNTRVDWKYRTGSYYL